MMEFQYHAFGKKLTPTDISLTIKGYALEFLNYGLTIRTWRHIADFLLRRFVTPSALLLEMMQRNISLQGGHSIETVRQWYAIQPGMLKDSDLEMYQFITSKFHVVCSEIKQPCTALFTYSSDAPSPCLRFSTANGRRSRKSGSVGAIATVVVGPGSRQ